MRKKVSGLILCFALLFSLPLPAFAANQVNTMDIQAVIYEDGSMYVTQVWNGGFQCIHDDCLVWAPEGRE
jgi:hypothetical protein